jgi:PAS domain S-box-containing protein
MTPKKTKEDFLVEIQELRRQLEEAEEILSAIRYDQIDAVVVLGPEGHQVHLLRRDNRNYRILVETICEGTVVMTREGSIFFCNSRFAEMVGNAVEALIGSPMLSYVPEEEHGKFDSLLEEAYKKSCGRMIHLKSKDGILLPVNLSVNWLQIEDAPGVCLVITDLSEQQKNEEILAARTRELEEVNAALKILLKQREADKSEFEENILSNVRNLIFPYLEKLNRTRSRDEQATYCKILETRMNEITAPFVRKLSRTYTTLTVMEIQVADLIRSGKCTKEIAELLQVSENTVMVHRQRIRTKLGLSNTKINLASHLKSFFT